MSARKRLKTKEEMDRYFAYQARLSLAPIALPQSLNDYFSDVIPHMGNVLMFMRKYVGQDEYVKKIIETYDSLPPHMRRDAKRVDLDYLTMKSGVEPTIVKERILVALSRYGESKFKLIMSIYGEEVIKEIVAIALDSGHPDSQKNKELVAEYLGIKAIPKSAQINIIKNEINQDNSTNNVLNLPTVAETLMPIERAIKEKMLIEDRSTLLIDIDEVQQVDQRMLAEAEEIPDDEDEDEDEMEEELDEA